MAPAHTTPAGDHPAETSTMSRERVVKEVLRPHMTHEYPPLWPVSGGPVRSDVLPRKD
jgi:hypothetical protein